ncbi:MAG TPA: acylphosphatase [Puia sp.]|nr:acylphosphatase [Puia sp.]
MTVHLTISGKVQGVFFRASARDMALTLEIRGWVKNTSEGNVEILANGNDISIRQFIAWCRKGPANAMVAHVAITEVEEKEFENFSILR